MIVFIFLISIILGFKLQAVECSVPEVAKLFSISKNNLFTDISILKTTISELYISKIMSKVHIFFLK